VSSRSSKSRSSPISSKSILFVRGVSLGTDVSNGTVLRDLEDASFRSVPADVAGICPPSDPTVPPIIEARRPAGAGVRLSLTDCEGSDLLVGRFSGGTRGLAGKDNVDRL